MTRRRARWTEAAVADLQEIVRFVARDSPAQAWELLGRLETRAATLLRSPPRGRVVPQLEALGVRTWRQVLVGPHRIVYRVAGSSIWILAALDSRRELRDVLLHRLLRTPIEEPE